MRKPATTRKQMGWLLGAACIAVIATGCTPGIIKGTKVRATSRNKAVVQVVQQYRYLFMSKQWDKLIKLVSPRFHETRGTPDASDDYGYATLRKKMQSQEARKIRWVRLKIHVDKIMYPNPKEAHVFVRSAYTYVVPRGKYRPKLYSSTKLHKMILEFDRGRWLFRRW